MLRIATLSVMLAATAAVGAEYTADVMIYGGTSAGVAAAVQAALAQLTANAKPAAKQAD